MKVKELIEQLQKLPADMNVRLRGTQNRDCLIAYDIEKVVESGFVHYEKKIREQHCLIEVAK